MTTEHSHPELEQRFDRLERRFDQLDIEVGMILDVLNQHTRTLAEIRQLLRDRGRNGG